MRSSMAEPARPVPHRPGAVSLFFVVKAGVFALGCWIWLLVLVLGEDAASGAHVFAATGATTTTLVGVLLGVRLAIQRNAAVRHAELKRLLVDISWNAFTAAGNAEHSGQVVPFPTLPPDSERLTLLDRGDRGRGGGSDRRR
ncbi:hypothetical protein MRQ36_09775 [Micromonospora sp. R77]|uniref:hypothetical protein n=1 Tax=Micromonospora sp. R77 TaxID=2925836 RepID=UPI001F61934B|nr:hypothetical protein [Micromonospora sp. R77]MCI4062842.1 hypothetical protein [Micromonospora sp. R77]